MKTFIYRISRHVGSPADSTDREIRCGQYSKDSAWVAWFEDDPDNPAAGNSEAEAIGNLIIRCAKEPGGMFTSGPNLRLVR